MTINPVNGTPGLWRAGDANTAGVHALIIGVSDYPYLSGGSAPIAARAPDNGGLGQLEVSAYSAALFFDWMTTAAEIGGAPLASCRLHLAPRPDEKEKVDQLTQAHYADATYAVLRTALDEWGAEMAVAGRTSQSPNVALFFYSGHGVEVAASPAILASDVLNQMTADAGAGKAVAVDPMTTAIKTYNINRGLFFVDACRDAPMAARLLNLVGDQSLTPNRTPVRRPDALIRLQSTASGLKAYQVKDGAGTLFTQAVLNGLQGPPPQFIPYDTTNLPWPLRFSALEGHVKRMVSALLADFSPLAVQSVEPYGNPYNGEMIVARKDGPPLDAGDELPPTAQRIPSVEEAVHISATNVLRNAKSLDMAAIDNLRQRPLSSGGDLFNFRIMHEVLGHENVTDPWIQSLRFLNARSGEAADPQVARIFASHTQQIGGRIAAWVDLAVEPGEGDALWIGAGGGDDAPSAAVVIPRDQSKPIPVRLDVLFNAGERDWQLTQMGARLADPAGLDERLPDSWTTLFQAQRTEAFADLGSAAQFIEGLADLEEVVSGKRDSPVAAGLAVNLLLRAGGLEYLHDWPRNLANWFPWFADGPILWAETLLRRHPGNDVADRQAQRDALDYFTRLADRGVPLLANTLLLALGQAERWRPLAEADELGGRERSDLRAALEYVDRAGRYAVSGVGFSRFVSSEMEIDPHIVLGAARRRAEPLRARYA